MNLFEWKTIGILLFFFNLFTIIFRRTDRWLWRNWSVVSHCTWCHSNRSIVRRTESHLCWDSQCGMQVLGRSSRVEWNYGWNSSLCVWNIQFWCKYAYYFALSSKVEGGCQNWAGPVNNQKRGSAVLVIPFLQFQPRSDLCLLTTFILIIIDLRNGRNLSVRPALMSYLLTKGSERIPFGQNLSIVRQSLISNPIASVSRKIMWSANHSHWILPVRSAGSVVLVFVFVSHHASTSTNGLKKLSVEFIERKNVLFHNSTLTICYKLFHLWLINVWFVSLFCFFDYS